MGDALDWDHTWYEPGDWSLPQWWTGGVTVRVGFVACYEDQQYFYSSAFVRNVLGHTGGMTVLPATTKGT